MRALLYRAERLVGGSPVAFVLGGLLGAWVAIVVVVALLMAHLGS